MAPGPGDTSPEIETTARSGTYGQKAATQGLWTEDADVGGSTADFKEGELRFQRSPS